MGQPTTLKYTLASGKNFVPYLLYKFIAMVLHVRLKRGPPKEPFFQRLK